MRLKPRYVFVEVLAGRKALEKHLLKNGPIKVMLEVELTAPFSGDDGERIEFEGTVTKMKVIDDNNSCDRS